MAATYTPGGSRDIDKIRSAIGDVELADAVLQDEEITAFRAAYSAAESGLYHAIADAAEAVLARYAHRPDRESRSNEFVAEWNSRQNALRVVAEGARARARDMELREASPPASEPAVGRLQCDTSWVR